MTSADKATTVLDPTTEMRSRMVERLKDQRGAFRAGPVEDAFRAVPRHLFLPGVDLDKVYSGDVIPTKFDEQKRPISSSSEVSVMAAMAYQLELERGHRVLEIGAGTGYNAAILAHIVGEDGAVTTIDLDPVTAREAGERLATAGYGRVRAEAGDGWDGVADGAPYDRIELTASVTDLSPRWSEQLAEGGLIVAPLSVRATQTIAGLRKRGARFDPASVVDGGFMALRGPHGWSSEGTTVDKWLVARGDGEPVDVETLSALLRLKPKAELDQDLPSALAWRAMSLLALSEPGVLSMGLKDGPGMWAVGIADPTGLAVAHLGGGPFTGPLMQYVSFGDAAPLERLRARIREFATARREDLRIEAVPTGSGERPRGEVIVPREHYTFGISLRAARSANA